MKLLIHALYMCALENHTLQVYELILTKKSIIPRKQKYI